MLWDIITIFIGFIILLGPFLFVLILLIKKVGDYKYHKKHKKQKKQKPIELHEPIFQGVELDEDSLLKYYQRENFLDEIKV